MKKLIKLFVITIFLLPIIVNAKPNVEITKVVLGSRSENTEIVKNATFDGLNVKFDVKFAEVGDNIVYKVTIKNNDNRSYQLQQGKVFNDSDYITYTTKFEGGTVINAKSTKQATITIKYANEVPADKFVNGKFEEADNMVISLSDSEIRNPQTSTTGIVIALVLLLLVIGTVIVIKGHTKAKLLTVMALFLSVPFATLAISKVTITINSKVQIVNSAEYCIINTAIGEEQTFEFTRGISLTDYCLNSGRGGSSSFCEVINHEASGSANDDVESSGSSPIHFMGRKLITCYSQESSGHLSGPKEPVNGPDDDPCQEFADEYEDVSVSNKIMDKSKGCYVYEPLDA